MGTELAWFFQKKNDLQGNCCILWIDIAWGLQQLGLILESKMVQKLSLEKNVFTKKWSLKLIFLNDFFFEKIPLIFNIENWLWKYDFDTFLQTGAPRILKIQ